jgi:predicted RNA-binding protein YlqC (UPF0109 family)
MPARDSRLADSLRRLGQTQVFEWDFKDVIPALKQAANTEIDLTSFIKRTAQIRVFEWDFKDVIPALKQAANTEIDLTSFIKRTAQIRVFEWDFRSALPARKAPPKPAELAKPSRISLSQAELSAVTDRLRNFLQYVAVNLIDEPGQAQLKVIELAPNVLRFKLVLAKKDVMLLIGRNGFTAAAIRSLLKAAAKRSGIQVLLQIHSHEEEAELLASEAAQG